MRDFIYSTRPEWSEFHQRLVLVLWLGLLAGGVAMAIWASIDDHFPADVAVGHWLQDNSPGGQSVIDFVRDIGSSIAAVVTILVVSAGLFVSGRRRLAMVAVALLGGIAFQAILKELVDRPRTSILFLDQRAGFDSPSFPSGHTMSSILTASLLLYVAFRIRAPLPLRLPLVIWGVGIGFLSPWIAVSGGVHWPSDALGAAVWAWAGLLPLGVLMEAARRGDGLDTTREPSADSTPRA